MQNNTMAHLSHCMINVAMQFKKRDKVEDSHQYEHVDLCTPLQPPSSSVVSALFVFFVVCAYHIQDHFLS